MRVLSIDFDYFVSASGSFRALYFPDGGGEMGVGLCDIVWSSAYASAEVGGKPFENNVSVDLESLNRVSAFLRKQPRSTIFFAADSHKHAWQCVKDLCGYKRRKATVVNIDFHHDTYLTGKKSVHCGNWLKWLIEDGTVNNAYWVSCEDSDKESANGQIREMSLDEALRGRYDLIYICRSGWWTPPHVDSIFIDKLITPLKYHSGQTYCEKDIQCSRYDDDFKESVSSLKAVRLLMMERLREVKTNET